MTNGQVPNISVDQTELMPIYWAHLGRRESFRSLRSGGRGAAHGALSLLGLWRESGANPELPRSGEKERNSTGATGGQRANAGKGRGVGALCERAFEPEDPVEGPRSGRHPDAAHVQALRGKRDGGGVQDRGPLSGTESFSGLASGLLIGQPALPFSRGALQPAREEVTWTHRRTVRNLSRGEVPRRSAKRTPLAPIFEPRMLTERCSGGAAARCASRSATATTSPSIWTKSCARLVAAPTVWTGWTRCVSRRRRSA